MGENAVKVKDLTKAFGGVKAVEKVSMTVPVGQRRALIGPNGAGKTTLFNCITGTFPPTEGEILLFGKNITRLPEHRRTALGIGRTFQITNVFHNLTVLENVFLAIQGNSRQKWVMHRTVSAFTDPLSRAEEKLSLVGLTQRSQDTVDQLSYGEKRQLEIALALASEPRVLFLDEPCSGLSQGERQRIADIVNELPKDITVIIIEHDMTIALGLADQVAVLHRGSIILEGSPDEVRANPEVREVYLGKV
jgi:branched-chain amino acid transport system ATP-binding protein